MAYGFHFLRVAKLLVFYIECAQVFEALETLVENAGQFAHQINVLLRKGFWVWAVKSQRAIGERYIEHAAHGVCVDVAYDVALAIEIDGIEVFAIYWFAAAPEAQHGQSALIAIGAHPLAVFAHAVEAHARRVGRAIHYVDAAGLKGDAELGEVAAHADQHSLYIALSLHAPDFAAHVFDRLAALLLYALLADILLDTQIASYMSILVANGARSAAHPDNMPVFLAQLVFVAVVAILM